MPAPVIRFLVLVAPLLLVPSTASGQAHLVKDLNERPELFHGDVGTVLELVDDGRGGAFFVHGDDLGYELWHTDGSPEGASLLRDAMPGPGPDLNPFGESDHVPQGLTLSRGILFYSGFDGYDPESGALWRTDGTPGGTRIVARDPYHPLKIWNAPGGIFYSRYASATSAEIHLFWSDGTPGGTRVAADSITSVGDLTLLGDTAIFSGGDPVHPAGIFALRSPGADPEFLAALPASSWAPPGLLPCGVRICYVVDRTIWSTDGTSAGTWAIATMSAGLDFRWGWRAAGRYAYYSAQGQIWRTDGTPKGTAVVAGGENFAVLGETLFVTSYDVFNRVYVLLAIDSAGHIHSLASRPSFWDLEATDRFVFFGAPDGVFATDGQSVWNVGEPGARLFPAGSHVYYEPANDPGVVLWRSDGSPAVAALRRPAATRSSSPFRFTAVGSRTLISAFEGSANGSLFATDGTPDGTTLLCNHARVVALAGDLALFDGTKLYAGPGEVWRTDGTPRGTGMVTRAVSGPLAFASAGELASFVTREPDRYTLWSSDGTAAGTRRLAALSDWPTAVEAPGGAYDLSPKEIWWTDGTQPGTRRLATLDADFVHDPVAIRGKLCFFWSRYGELDDRLWCTDGAGIVALPPTNASRPVAAGDFVYFVGSDTEGTYRLFRSDGTVAGTRPLTAFPIGMQQWFSGAAWNGRFYFCGIDDAHGVELWSTDGTDAGTSLLADIEPGPESSFPREITAIGDRIVFSAATAERGLEPWITDGTPAGTRLVADIRPGPASSQPQLFTRVGEDVYFRANDGVHGLEPWRIRLTEIPPAR